MEKGYLWKATVGAGEEYFVVKDNIAVNEDTELFPALELVSGNTWEISPNPVKFTDFNVLEENLIIRRVDYNKKIRILVDINTATGPGTLTKETVGSVLTLTQEDLLILADNDPNQCITFGSSGTVMGNVLRNANFTPSAAYYNNGQGEGIYPAEGPVTIDFGEAWLGLIWEHPDHPELMILNTYGGTKCHVS